MADWGFLTTHARALVCLAHDPGARLRDIAATLGITERRAHGIVTDLAGAGYVAKQKDGCRGTILFPATMVPPGLPARCDGINEAPRSLRP